MRTTLAFNGSYFNTNRMVKQYTRNAYYPVKLIGARVEEVTCADVAVLRREQLLTVKQLLASPSSFSSFPRPYRGQGGR